MNLAELTERHMSRELPGFDPIPADEHDAVRWLQHAIDYKQDDPAAVFVLAMAIPDVVIDAAQRGVMVDPLTGAGDSLNKLTDAKFEHYESGKLRAGIKWINTQDGPQCPGECYQFDTLAELLDHARAFQNDPTIVSFSLLTHSGQYRNLRTVYKWSRKAD